MEIVIIGSVLSVIGVIGNCAMFISSALYPASAWTIPPGRFICSLQELGLLSYFRFFQILLFFGLMMLLYEFIKKAYRIFRLNLKNEKGPFTDE